MTDTDTTAAAAASSSSSSSAQAMPAVNTEFPETDISALNVDAALLIYAGEKTGETVKNNEAILKKLVTYSSMWSPQYFIYTNDCKKWTDWFPEHVKNGVFTLKTNFNASALRKRFDAAKERGLKTVVIFDDFDVRDTQDNTETLNLVISSNKAANIKYMQENHAKLEKVANEKDKEKLQKEYVDYVKKDYPFMVVFNTYAAGTLPMKGKIGLTNIILTSSNLFASDHANNEKEGDRAYTALNIIHKKIFDSKISLIYTAKILTTLAKTNFALFIEPTDQKNPFKRFNLSA